MWKRVQGLLDLWGEPPAAPVAVPATPQAPPPRAAPEPAILAHPQARHTVQLGGVRVAYALARGQRRSIGLRIDAEGLSVRAPARASQAEVDAALRQKADWILRKLAEAQSRQQRQQALCLVWEDGARLPYLGETLTLVLDPAHQFDGAGAALHRTEDGARQLRVSLPRQAQPAQIRDAVQAWLMREARRHFTERLDHFAPQLGVRWTRLGLSSAQTRWGSAKADGSIRLHWRLLHFRPAIIDYVVVHELAHLRVMDHSPRFWDTVAGVLPEHAQLRQGLREPLPRWA